MSPPKLGPTQAARERSLRIVDLELDSGLALAELARLRKGADPPGAEKCYQRAVESFMVVMRDLETLPKLSQIETAAFKRKVATLRSLLGV